MSCKHDLALWSAYVRDIVPLGRRTVAAQAPAGRMIERAPIGHTLDLHGVILAEAHRRTIEMLATARDRYGYVTIITGISGAINHEFRHWVADHPDVRRIEAIHGGGGYRVYFRKR